MDERKRLGIYLALLAAVAVVAVVVFAGQGKPRKPAPSAPGYYTGPMVNKAGNAITTEDGKIVERIKPGSRPSVMPRVPAGPKGNDDTQ